MSKILVQKTVVVTMELNEKEALGLRDLLHIGVSTDTLEALNLLSLKESLTSQLGNSAIIFSFKASLK